MRHAAGLCTKHWQAIAQSSGQLSTQTHPTITSHLRFLHCVTKSNVNTGRLAFIASRLKHTVASDTDHVEDHHANHPDDHENAENAENAELLGLILGKVKNPRNIKYPIQSVLYEEHAQSLLAAEKRLEDMEHRLIPEISKNIGISLGNRISDLVSSIIPDMVKRTQSYFKKTTGIEQAPGGGDEVVLGMGVDGTPESVAAAHAVNQMLKSSNYKNKVKLQAVMITTRNYEGMSHDSHYTKDDLRRDEQWTEDLAHRLKEEGILVGYGHRDAGIASRFENELMSEALSHSIVAMILPDCRERFIVRTLRRMTDRCWSRWSFLSSHSRYDVAHDWIDVGSRLPQDMLWVYRPTMEIPRLDFIAYCEKFQLPFRRFPCPKLDPIRADWVVMNLHPEISDRMSTKVQKTVSILEDITKSMKQAEQSKLLDSLVTFKDGWTVFSRTILMSGNAFERVLGTWAWFNLSQLISGDEYMVGLIEKYRSDPAFRRLALHDSVSALDEALGAHRQKAAVSKLGCIIKHLDVSSLEKMLPKRSFYGANNNIPAEHVFQSEELRRQKVLSVSHQATNVVCMYPQPESCSRYRHSLLKPGQLLNFEDRFVVGIEYANDDGESCFAPRDVGQCAVDACLEKHVPTFTNMFGLPPRSSDRFAYASRKSIQGNEMENRPVCSDWELTSGNGEDPLFRVRPITLEDWSGIGHYKTPRLNRIFRSTPKDIRLMGIVIEHVHEPNEYQERLAQFEQAREELGSATSHLQTGEGKAWRNFVFMQRGAGRQGSTSKPKPEEVAFVPLLGLDLYNNNPKYPDRRKILLHCWYLPRYRGSSLTKILPPVNIEDL